MPATTDSVIDGASMVLGSRQKINLPTCLPFAPSSALRKRLHSKAMRPFTRLEYGPKSSAFWWIYFLPQPLLLETLIDDSKIMRKTQDEKMA